MIRNSADITKIHNTYNLKSVFEYLDYQYILKLIKNNKNLQNKLEISFKNYKKESNYQSYQYIKNKEIYYFDDDCDNCENKKIIILTFYMIYVFIYMTFCSVFDFEDYDTKYYDSYSKFQIIKSINGHTWVIGLLLIIFITFIFVVDNNKCFYFNEKYRAIIIIISLLLQLISEGFAIWRLILSYIIIDEKILKSDWILYHMEQIIIWDYIFIVINFIITIYTLLHFRKNLKRYITTSSINYIIISLYNINIKEYTLPNGFITMSKYKQFQYILNKFKNIEYIMTQEQKDLIKLINEFREDNNLEKFLFDKNNKLPTFIIKKPAVIMLNPTQNFFQLSKKEYLFRYYIGDFKIKFQSRENNIISILSNKDINYIKIIGQEEYEYIFLRQLSCNETLDIYENNSKNENDYEYKLFTEEKL